MRKIGDKKAAIELSISTIVIVVLAMSMLILGLVLVRSIFSGTKYNIDQMNDGVRAEIAKLFTDDTTKGVIYLSGSTLKLKQGEGWGLAFGIINREATQKFSWEVVVNDQKIRQNCGITEAQALEWVNPTIVGDISLSSGQKHADLFFITIPEGIVSDVSTCIIRYEIRVKGNNGNPYTTMPFYLDITS